MSAARHARPRLEQAVVIERAALGPDLDARTGSAPRRSAVASVLVLPVADVLAMGLCFLLGGLVNFSFD
ncbi:MAG: hypothetical protein WAS21_27445, partial [Geminicoccaceae bacterium]